MAEKRQTKNKAAYQKKNLLKNKKSVTALGVLAVVAILLTLSTFSILPFSFPAWGDAYTLFTGEQYQAEPVVTPAEIPPEVQNISPPPEMLGGTVMSVYIIDVGQGSSTLFTTGDSTILIDAGENDKGDEVLACLQSLGINKIDYMIGSHPHSDHIGGMDDVLKNIQVDSVILPKIPDEIVPTTKTYQDVLNTLAENKTKVITAKPGKSYAVGAMKLDIFGPAADFDDLNDESVVAKVTFGKITVLVSGDAEKKAEKAVLEKGFALLSNIYIAGHHGSSTSSSKNFLDAIKPAYAAVSCGLNNDYGHPSTQTLQAFEDRKIIVNRTDLNGTIVYTTDGENIAVKTEK